MAEDQVKYEVLEEEWVTPPPEFNHQYWAERKRPIIIRLAAKLKSLVLLLRKKR